VPTDSWALSSAMVDVIVYKGWERKGHEFGEEDNGIVEAGGRKLTGLRGFNDDLLMPNYNAQPQTG